MASARVQSVAYAFHEPYERVRSAIISELGEKRWSIHELDDRNVLFFRDGDRDSATFQADTSDLAVGPNTSCVFVVIKRSELFDILEQHFGRQGL